MSPYSWDWPHLFQELVEKCDESGNIYCMSIEEAEKFRRTPIRKGFGLANLCKNVIPKYERKYPGYIFYVKDRDEPNDRKYLCCEHINTTCVRKSSFELKLDEAKEGFKRILDNVKMLIKDTEILADKDRYTSFPLGILSLEELGKAILLAKTIQQSKQKVSVGKWWFSHRQKLRSALMFNSGIPENLLDHIINTLEKARIEGLYVDWKDERWFYPQHEGSAWLERLRSPKDAREIIGSAKDLLEKVYETFRVFI